MTNIPYRCVLMYSKTSLIFLVVPRLYGLTSYKIKMTSVKAWFLGPEVRTELLFFFFPLVDFVL